MLFCVQVLDYNKALNLAIANIDITSNYPIILWFVEKRRFYVYQSTAVTRRQ